ncbi:MAG: bifunctional oligoribonuclease/PAP phosphatase NrnA [Flavobacteriaceae bacterium]|nr:bifunctional oligoribonuclease/PAP phosphatase NrnA [Flavobacteriaceae bacterium]
MNKEQISESLRQLDAAENIVILGHRNPDGDAIGATLGLAHYLRAKGKNCTVMMPNDFPKFLAWIPGASDILIFEHYPAKAVGLLKSADLVYTLDFNHFSRVGEEMQRALEGLESNFIMIDHHQQPEGYAVVTYSDPSMSSTCEMVYHYIAALGDQELLTKELAQCLYVGIMTDTGSFRFAATTSTTHRIIAHLMDLGAKNDYIHQQVYDTNSESRMALLGTALRNMVVLADRQVAYITLSKEELESGAYKKGDTEGFVNYGLSLEGIVFAVIFIENIGEEYIKISFRSKGSFSVNEFARAHFQGGGHDNAAGGRSEMNMADTIEKFESLLPTYQQQIAESISCE